MHYLHKKNVLMRNEVNEFMQLFIDLYILWSPNVIMKMVAKAGLVF